MDFPLKVLGLARQLAWDYYDSDTIIGNYSGLRELFGFSGLLQVVFCKGLWDVGRAAAGCCNYWGPRDLSQFVYPLVT